jgi:hypothetical protein
MNGLLNHERDIGVNRYIEGFSGENWTPQADVLVFAGLLCEIAVGCALAQSIRDRSVPSVVSHPMDKGQSAHSGAVRTFWDVLNTLKEAIYLANRSRKANNFRNPLSTHPTSRYITASSLFCASQSRVCTVVSTASSSTNLVFGYLDVLEHHFHAE